MWSEVPSHRIEVPPGADSLLAVGGGSAIDTAKAASAATGLPVVSVPTTYSGAEWTPSFGVRSPDRRMVGGGGGANLAGIVYEVELTLDLPRAETVGTAMNALAHCAEALYVRGRNDAADGRALSGARADRRVAAARRRRAAATSRRGPSCSAGRAHAGEALALAGLGLGHAMAQALGGSLRPAARSDERALPAARAALRAGQAPDAVARFGAAIGGRRPGREGRGAGAASAASAGCGDLGVPEADLPAVAAAAARARRQPVDAAPGDAPPRSRQLSRSIYG